MFYHWTQLQSIETDMNTSGSWARTEGGFFLMATTDPNWANHGSLNSRSLTSIVNYQILSWTC